MLKNKSFKNLLSYFIVLLAIIVLVISGIIIFIPEHTKSQTDITSFEGYKIIKAQEEKDASVVDDIIRKRDIEAKLSNMSVWDKLNFFDLYLLGDSRCIGFHFYDFDSNHNWAKSSTTIKNIADYYEDIENAKPHYLMISYGMNDLGMYQFDPENYWETGADYVKAFKEYTDHIKEISPDTQIMICSILPALEAGTVRQDRWLLVDDFNEYIKQFCEDESFLYVDMTETAYAHTDLYEDDGVHFYTEFYPYWAEVIAETIESSL